jgi:hypothetical protein
MRAVCRRQLNTDHCAATALGEPSSLIPSESCNQRAMQVWQNHASDELCSIFRDGRSSTRPSRSEGHTRFSPIVRVIHDSALSRLREVVGITPGPRSRR